MHKKENYYVCRCTFLANKANVANVHIFGSFWGFLVADTEWLELGTAA